MPPHTPWRFEEVLRFGFYLMLSMTLAMAAQKFIHALGASFGEAGQQLILLTASTLFFHGCIILLAPWFARRHSMNLGEAFGFKRYGLVSVIWFAVIAAIVVTPLIMVMGQVVEKVMTFTGMDPKNQTAVDTLLSTPHWYVKAAYGFVAIIVAPVAEEILFRGILFPTVRDLGFRKLAFFGTALLFGAIHGNIMTLLPLAFLAMALNWIYERTGNLLATMITHALFNLVNFVWIVSGHAG